MSGVNNGGPAYPTTFENEHGVKFTDHGMTLRDYFAGQASDPSDDWLHMQRGIDRSRNPHNDAHKPAPRDTFQLVAEWKYAIADAMIAAREGEQ